MVAFGLLLAFFTGFSCLLFLNKQNVLSWQELVGLSFPGGIAQIVFIMLALDWIGIPLTCLSMSLSAMCLILFWLGLSMTFHRLLPITFKKPHWNWVNLAWCVFFGAVVYLAYINFQNTLYYPFLPHKEIDSISGYESIGYLVSQEHTLRRLAIFRPEESPLMRVPTSYIGYAPLTQLSFAYIRLFGSETAKVIPAFMFISFLLAFYGLVKRNSSNLSAILATFFTIISPHLLEVSFVSMTNAPHIIYTTLGILYGSDYIFNNRKRTQETFFLWLSVWFLSASVLTRSDGIVFPCALGIILLYECLRKRISVKLLLLWSFSILGVLVFWALFRKTGNMATENFFIKHFFIDTPRIQTIVKTSFKLLLKKSYYGWTFYLAAAVLLPELFFVFKKKASLLSFIVPALALGLYFILLYHMDYSVWAPIDAVLIDSASRFYICLVPLFLFAVFSSYSLGTLLKKIENGLSLTKCSCCLPLLFLMPIFVSCSDNKSEKQDIFYTEKDLKIGDYFYQDGTWSDGGLRAVYADGSYRMTEEIPMPTEGKQVIGIIFQTDTNRIGKAEKEALHQAGIAHPHGLVMSVKTANNGSACSWGSWGRYKHLKTIREKDCFQDISGLYHQIRFEQAKPEDYNNESTALVQARTFQAIDSLDAPANTSGWFLPSIGQWWDICQNLGGVTILGKPEEQTSRASASLFWYGQKGICDKLNAWMQHINPADRHLFKHPVDLYWTSSEYDHRRVRYVALDNNYGYLYMEWGDRPYRHYVRCVLAF